MRDVVHEHDAHGAAVIGSSDGVEAFLSGRIPNLQLDFLAIQLNRLDFKVDA